MSVMPSVDHELGMMRNDEQWAYEMQWHRSKHRALMSPLELSLWSSKAVNMCIESGQREQSIRRGQSVQRVYRVDREWTKSTMCPDTQ